MSLNATLDLRRDDLGELDPLCNFAGFIKLLIDKYFLLIKNILLYTIKDIIIKRVVHINFPRSAIKVGSLKSYKVGFHTSNCLRLHSVEYIAMLINYFLILNILSVVIAITMRYIILIYAILNRLLGLGCFNFKPSFCFLAKLLVLKIK